MSEIIGRTIPVTSRTTEKVGAVDSSVAIKRDRPRDGKEYEDEVDIAPRRHMAQNSENMITLSLQMAAALLAEELPEEALNALRAFAPLGDITAMRQPYDALAAGGHETVDWPHDLSLEQALYRAARL